MFDSILDSLKGEVAEGLSKKIGLSNLDIDNTIASSKEALNDTVSKEVASNGMDGLLNLFSKDDNSESSNGILKSLGGNLVSSLLSKGFSSDSASSIKDQILPVIMNLVVSKIGGDSSKLSGLLSADGISDIAAGTLKEKASSLLGGLFN